MDQPAEGELLAKFLEDDTSATATATAAPTAAPDNDEPVDDLVRRLRELTTSGSANVATGPKTVNMRTAS